MPAPLAEVLEQLDGAVSPTRPQPSRRPCERLPGSVLALLQQQHLAAGRVDRNPRGHDLRVVDDHELPLKLVRELGEGAVSDRARLPLVAQ